MEVRPGEIVGAPGLGLSLASPPRDVLCQEHERRGGVGHHRPVQRRALPIFDWVPRYRRADLAVDVVAGLTIAAVLIPQSMAYAQIGGVPPVVGLYASVLPAFAYAALGHSRQLTVGPLSTIAIVGALAVGQLAPSGSDRFIALTASLALMVGVIGMLLAIARLGFLIRFISEPVLVGFLAGAAIVIMANQLGALFGYHVPIEGRAYQTIYEWADRLDQTNATSLLIGLVGVVVLVATHRFGRLPTALLYLSLVTAAVSIFDLDAPVVGDVPSGLAGFSVPPLEWGVLRTLVPTAAVILLIAYVEAYGVERRLADEHGEDIDPNRELLAFGAANTTAGVFQGMPVTGVPSRTAVADAAGARTQLAGVVSVIVIVPVLLFASGLLHNLPTAALAAVVLVSIAGFIRVGELRRMLRVRRSDGLIAIGAFAGVVVLGLELGIIVAALGSIVMVIYRATNPRVSVLGRLEGTNFFVDLRRSPTAVTYAGVLIVRPDAPLNFASSTTFDHSVRRLLEQDGDLHTLVLDASGVDHLDVTADHKLRILVGQLRDRGIHVVLVNVDGEVLEVMRRSGLATQLGTDAFFATDADAIAHLESGI